MKFTAATTLALAGSATASYGYPRHFHYRRDNVTSAAGADQTTLTVIATSVHTVTSCAPTVTNCPAANNTAAISALPSSALATGVVTDIIELTTTVCPATAAASISSSVVAAHSSGLLPGKTITGAEALPTGETVIPTDIVTDVPVTYTTTGASGEESTITTTIHSTIHSQVTVHVSKPTGGASAAGSASGSAGLSTNTQTSTGTRTVTLQGGSGNSGATGVATSANSAETGANSGTGSNSGSSSGSSSNGAGANGDCPAAVTVTLPASTVYVTVTGAAAQQTGSVVNNGSKATDSGSDTEEDEDEDECPTSTGSVVTAEVTATVVPYPVGSPNGTTPFPTGGPKFRRFHH